MMSLAPECRRAKSHVTDTKSMDIFVRLPSSQVTEVLEYLDPTSVCVLLRLVSNSMAPSLREQGSINAAIPCITNKAMASFQAALVWYARTNTTNDDMRSRPMKIWFAEEYSDVKPRAEAVLLSAQPVTVNPSIETFQEWCDSFACQTDGCGKPGSARNQCSSCGDIICADHANICENSQYSRVDSKVIKSPCAFALCGDCHEENSTVDHRLPRSVIWNDVDKPGLMAPSCQGCPVSKIVPAKQCLACLDLCVMECGRCQRATCAVMTCCDSYFDYQRGMCHSCY